MRHLGSFGWPLLVTALLGGSLGVSSGCVQKNDAASGGGGGAGGGGGSGGATAAPPTNWSCLQILQCIVECTDLDGPCPDECAARGSADGYSKVVDLATCIETQQCTEETCVQDYCGTELSSCVDSSAPPTGGEPLPGSAPPGSVPGDLVGFWEGAANGDTTRLTLNADGTGSWEVARTWQQYACLSFERLTKSGSIVVEETTMTVYATSVIREKQTCMPPSSQTQEDPVTEKIQWSRDTSDPNAILMVDGACAAQYPGQENCNTLGCPIGLYCTYRLYRK